MATSFRFDVGTTPPEVERRRKKAMEDAASQHISELNLVPFTALPKVSFDNVRMGKAAIRKLKVKNPGKKPCRVQIDSLPKEECGFQVDYTSFVLPGGYEVILHIGWAPPKSGNWREKIGVKYGMCHTQIILIASCPAPPDKLRGRRPAKGKAGPMPPSVPRAPNPVQRQSNNQIPEMSPIAYNPDDIENQPPRQNSLSIPSQPETMTSWSPQKVHHLGSSKQSQDFEPIAASSSDLRRETFIKLDGPSFISSTPACKVNDMDINVSAIHATTTKASRELDFEKREGQFNRPAPVPDSDAPKAAKVNPSTAPNVEMDISKLVQDFLNFDDSVEATTALKAPAPKGSDDNAVPTTHTQTVTPEQPHDAKLFEIESQEKPPVINFSTPLVQGDVPPNLTMSRISPPKVTIVKTEKRSRSNTFTKNNETVAPKAVVDAPSPITNTFTVKPPVESSPIPEASSPAESMPSQPAGPKTPVPLDFSSPKYATFIRKPVVNTPPSHVPSKDVKTPISGSNSRDNTFTKENDVPQAPTSSVSSSSAPENGSNSKENTFTKEADGPTSLDISQSGSPKPPTSGTNSKENTFTKEADGPTSMDISQSGSPKPPTSGTNSKENTFTMEADEATPEDTPSRKGNSTPIFDTSSKDNTFTKENDDPTNPLDVSSPRTSPPKKASVKYSVATDAPSTFTRKIPIKPQMSTSSKAAPLAKRIGDKDASSPKSSTFTKRDAMNAQAIIITPSSPKGNTFTKKSDTKAVKALAGSRVQRPLAPSRFTSRRSVAADLTRKTLMKPLSSGASSVRHPNPFAAKNMYYDERWMLKQENGLVKWLNFILTPNDVFEEENVKDSPNPKVDVAQVWKACAKDVRTPRAPTREILSIRAYNVRRELNKLRKSAWKFWQSKEIFQVVTKLEIEIEKRRLMIRDDKNLPKDSGMKKSLLQLLLNYHPLWLRLGLETVYGEMLTADSTNSMEQLMVVLSQFIVNRLLSCPDIQAEYAHPTVPHLYKDGFDQALKQFILRKFLQLVFFLDRAKSAKLIRHDPCLFVKTGKVKASRDILVAFSRDFLSGEGDITRHLAYLGFTVEQKQTALDEFDYAVTSLPSDMKNGIRLCRVVEQLANVDLSRRLRMPALNRTQKLHNNTLALTALPSHARFPASVQTTLARGVSDGQLEVVLKVIWHILYRCEIQPNVLDTSKLLNEIQNLRRSLKLAAKYFNKNEAKKGLSAINDPQGRNSMEKCEKQADDWLNDESVQLLLQWAKLVCAHYGLQVDNFSVSFSDGRALCFLIHHYMPAFLTREAIKESTSISAMDGNADKSLNCSLDDSFGTMVYSMGQSPEHYEQLINNEKSNFKLFHHKATELGGIPILIKCSDMSNTIPDAKVTVVFLSYLAKRLLALSAECEAARTIQRHWRAYAAKKRLQKVKNKYQ